MAVEEVRSGTTLELESEPLGRIVVHGERNTIRIGRNVTLNATIWIQGDGGLIEIGDDCNIDGMIRTVRGEGGVIRIGRGTTINAAGLSMHETGEILIGDDCMFSTDIHMDVSDMHPIFDRATGERINPARSIHIADRVWLGTRVLVMKGARIGSGTVIGAGSMVAGQLPSNVIAMGTPAVVVRENIEWRRTFDETISVSPAAPPPRRARRWLDRLRARVR